MADENNERIKELEKVLEQIKDADQFMSADQFKKLTGKTPEQLGLALDNDGEIGYTQVHAAYTKAQREIDLQDGTLNPKLQAMFEGGTKDYLGVVREEPNERAKLMKELAKLESPKSSGGSYKHREDIEAHTGKTLEDLGLEADSDNEVGISDLDKEYKKNTKRINKFQEFLDNEGSEQDYIDVVSGKYADTTDWTYGYGYAMRDALTQSKYNSPANNFKVAQELGRSEDEDADSYRSNFADQFNLGWDSMEHILSNSGWEDKRGYLMGNDNVNDGHIYKMTEMYPEFIAQGLNHDKVNDRAREMFLDKDENWEHVDNRKLEQLMDKNIRGQTPDGYRHGDDRDKPTSKFSHQVLKNKPGLLREKNLDTVLGGLDDHDRNKWIDETLGITGGEHQHTLPNESEGFDADNWDNWTEGSGASLDFPLRKAIASSKHLTDEQADHIKRHGDFDSKYALYHNTNIDTKHGTEMYKKWAENHDTHGYDSDELIEKFKEDKDDKFGFDELPEDVQDELTESDSYYEYIDEQAEYAYNLDDYMNDNQDSIVEKMKQSGSFDELMEHVDEAVANNYDDWTGANPDSQQNIGNPQFDALDNLNDEHELENSMFTADELGEDSVKVLAELKVTPDEDGDFDGDQILDKLNDFGGPSQIDYSGHDERHMSEHPEYAERYDESIDDVYKDALNGNIEGVSPWEISDKLYLYEDHRESDGYESAQSDASDEWKADTSNFQEHADELYTSSHTDDRFIPDHIAEQMPELSEVRKQRIRDARSSDIEDLPNRAFEHAYGENQHHHELLKDYADANGGSMDVGKMHKKFPNLKETWKKIFSGKGKLSSDDIQQKIDDIPKTNYDITYGNWKADRMQNINGRNQVIVRLDHSDESLRAIHDHEDPAVKEMFNKIQNVSKQSGHPTNDRTIAWARVDTSDPEHWMIDEVQSDFGKTAQKYLKDQGHGDKANAIKTINDTHKDWRETITNHVIKTAKTHGAMKISTHSPESKASHTGSSSIHTVYKDSYKKVPKKMGFQEAHHSELPLTDKGRKSFAPTSTDHPETTEPSKPIEHKGHTLDLTPEALKKAIEVVIDLIKTEMKLGRIRKSMFDQAFSLKEPEDLDKGEIGRAAKGLVVAGAMAIGAQGMYGEKPESKAPVAQERSIASVKPEPTIETFKQKRDILGAIEDNHTYQGKGIERGSHNKEKAYGRHGLSPITIKETIKAHPDLKQKYGHLTNFKSQLFQSGMKAADKDGQLINEIASRHYDKLAQHFDNDPAKISHAWKHGVTGTKAADKYGMDISNNNHVKKVMRHYNKRSTR